MASSPPLLTLVAARTRDRVIGRDNQLLWHLPEDMAHFRRVTQGLPVLMGRKTWESLPERFRPLPGRRNVVLTRQHSFAAPGAEVVGSLPEALALFEPGADVCVIGGEQIYRAALPLAKRLTLTELDLQVAGDAWFPTWPADEFREVAREVHRAQAPNDFDFAFVTYERVRAAT